MITKKDFELIATCIRDSIEQGFISNPKMFCSWMADTLALTNVRFDTQRFIDACTPTKIVGNKDIKEQF